MERLSAEHGELLERALDNMGAVVVVDEHCRIVYMNDDYADTVRIPPPYPIGEYLPDVVPGAGLAKTMLSGKNQYALLYRAGDGRYVVNNEIAVKRDGAVIGGFSYSILFPHAGAGDVCLKLESVLSDLGYDRGRDRPANRAAYDIENIVSQSPKMEELKRRILQVAQTRSTVLITGESGTGKELAAQSIHSQSRRKNGPFVRLNCAAIPAELLESELFGYEPGSFTGALRGGAPGKFQLADGGTLLLDEIDLLPLNLQAKLLRVIQEKEVQKIGGQAPVKVDVRLICTTNQDLRELAAKKAFREDLYYRVSVVTLTVPPLRERPEDIPALVRHFIRKLNREMEMSISGVSEEVLERMLAYGWPGNIRELENSVESAFNFAVSGELRLEHFPNLRAAERPRPRSLREIRQAAEKQAIEAMLRQCGGNKKLAAESLRLSRTSFYQKLREYGIEA